MTVEQEMKATEEEWAMREWCSQTKQQLELDKLWLGSEQDYNDPDTLDELWDTFAMYDQMIWKMKAEKDKGSVFSVEEEAIYQAISKEILLPIFNLMRRLGDESFLKQHNKTVALVLEITPVA
ncbi:hypothetical protein CVD28_02685 [Bacillus sp. M6-12]|uniref:hypothetical protein n=1 Tax=Bacillus sp. M6-12 TaxID=2054166 RepID=UPI000C792E10|nr:hypothetical protein [Bacillus sp. M6-12]PLS19339.1 hypothetical protein CVD28_02685 [Bacillus sp. M6-12]